MGSITAPLERTLRADVGRFIGVGYLIPVDPI
jgi:hypothetical protein